MPPFTRSFHTQRFTQVTVLLVLAITLATTGCQNRAASKLVGRWDMLPPAEIDNASSPQNDDSKERASDNTEDLFNSIADGETVGTMSLVFHRNGKLETFTDFPMASTGKPKIGKWSLKSWDNKKQTAILECDLFDELTETKVTFIDDDTIQLVPPNIAVLKMELRFRRRN